MIVYRNVNTSHRWVHGDRRTCKGKSIHLVQKSKYQGKILQWQTAGSALPFVLVLSVRLWSVLCTTSAEVTTWLWFCELATLTKGCWPIQRRVRTWVQMRSVLLGGQYQKGEDSAFSGLGWKRIQSKPLHYWIPLLNSNNKLKDSVKK